jgi:hypothetical protein
MLESEKCGDGKIELTVAGAARGAAGGVLGGMLGIPRVLRHVAVRLAMAGVKQQITRSRAEEKRVEALVLSSDSCAK